jgi:hypothetical protein
LSDSHWGGSSLKWPVLTVLATFVIGAGLIALFAWSPWVKPTEVEWLGTYRAWSDGIDASLHAGGTVSRTTCEATFDDEVGNPPKERLQPVASAARRGCAALSPGGWWDGRSDVVRALIDVHDDLLPPRQRPALSQLARSSVGVRPAVYCWQPAGWAAFYPHYEIVRGGYETSLSGIADSRRNRIDLDPAVCGALGRYLRRIRPSALSYENVQLAEALAVLTHQAEHLKTPSASEAEVECYALQHVRPLVRTGWDAAFANEIALHAWEISYLALPQQFRTPACRNGGRLDRNPRSSAWP